MFEAIDQPFDAMTLPIGTPIERTSTLVPLVRDRHPHPTATGSRAICPTAVPFVANAAAGTQFGTPAPRTFGCSLIEQRRKLGARMPLAGSEQQRQRFALPLGALVHLGTPSALALAQRLVGGPPFLAPAAC